MNIKEDKSLFIIAILGLTTVWKSGIFSVTTAFAPIVT
jgi:hypothetical protein